MNTVHLLGLFPLSDHGSVRRSPGFTTISLSSLHRVYNEGGILMQNEHFT